MRNKDSLHPSSSLWSPQSLSPSHCHWAGMQVHSPNALTAHVKWFLPHEHSVLPWTPAHTHTHTKRRLEFIAHAQVNSGTGIHITTKWFCQIYIITVKYWDRDFYPCPWPPALFLALILTLLSCSLLSMLDKSLRMPQFFVINKNTVSFTLM